MNRVFCEVKWRLDQIERQKYYLQLSKSACLLPLSCLSAICCTCVWIHVCVHMVVTWAWGLMAGVAALINWTLIKFLLTIMNDLKIVLSHYFQLFLIFLQTSLTSFSLFFFNQTLFPSFARPPSFAFLHSAASLVSFLGDYVPSLPLFNLIKENAIQLSFSWPIASFFFTTSYCYSLTLYGCQSGTQPMLFPGMDVVALAIMTFLLVSHSRRSAPEDTGTAILDEPCYSFMFSVPDYKGLVQSSGGCSCQSAHLMLGIGQRSTAEANSDWLKTHSKCTQTAIQARCHVWRKTVPKTIFFKQNWLSIISVWLPLPLAPNPFPLSFLFYVFWKSHFIKWRSMFFIPIILTAHYNSRGDID